MPYTTEEPVAIESADRWSIADIHIDPGQPAITYQLAVFNGNAEVRRVSVSMAGAELMASEGVPELYATIKAMLYADAQARGLIPESATEE